MAILTAYLATEPLGITELQPTFSKIRQRARSDSIGFLVHVVPLGFERAAESRDIVPQATESQAHDAINYLEH